MRLKKFKDELPRLNVAKPIISSSTVDRYEIVMSQVLHRFHSDMPQVPVWAYAGTYPGPVIDAPAGRAVEIKWVNRLPTQGDFPFVMDVPPGPMGKAMVPATMPPVKAGHAVVHVHGAHCPSESDGLPDAFTHPEESGHTPTSALCHYPNKQPGATLWFHDHTMGTTRLNVYAGLAGAYLLRDKLEANLNLPSGAYEVPIIIQDRMFDSADNPQKLLYQTSAGQPEFFGDHVVVNGTVWPKLSVEPRRYRFRMINGSNARFYSLALKPLASSNCATAFQIGSDGGFLPAPVPLCLNGQSTLLIAPGERADVIIDFSGFSAGDEILLTNDAAAPYTGDPNEKLLPDSDMSQILKFSVKYKSSEDTSVIPPALPCDLTIKIDDAKVPLRDVSAVAAALAQERLPPIKIRRMTLEEIMDADGNPVEVLLNGKHYADPVTETPQLNAVEIWELDNLTGDTHPIHLHLVQFQLLDRKRKADGGYTAVDPNELGWKDTVRCPPEQITRIIARFTSFTGKFVWHCHMLEHEDHDMMRPFIVKP